MRIKGILSALRGGDSPVQDAAALVNEKILRTFWSLW